MYISLLTNKRFYGVVVSTLDFESSDLGSTPGRTFFNILNLNFSLIFFLPAVNR